MRRNKRQRGPDETCLVSLSSPRIQDFRSHTEVLGPQYPTVLPWLSHPQVGHTGPWAFPRTCNNHGLKGFPIYIYFFLKMAQRMQVLLSFLSYHNHLLPSAERKKRLYLTWYIALGYEAQACTKGNWKYPGHFENRNHSNDQVPTPFSVQVFPKSLLSAKLEEKLIEAGS